MAIRAPTSPPSSLICLPFTEAASDWGGLALFQVTTGKGNKSGWGRLPRSLGIPIHEGSIQVLSCTTLNISQLVRRWWCDSYTRTCVGLSPLVTDLPWAEMGASGNFFAEFGRNWWNHLMFVEAANKTGRVIQMISSSQNLKYMKIVTSKPTGIMVLNSTVSRGRMGRERKTMDRWDQEVLHKLMVYAKYSVCVCPCLLTLQTSRPHCLPPHPKCWN